MTRVILRAAALLILVACGDDAPATDAGLDGSLDAAFDADTGEDGGRPIGALEGPTVVYLGQDACYRTGLVATAYVFHWGDAERTETSAPEACHRFPYAGAFRVSVVAGSRQGSLAIRVVLPPARTPPSASSPLARHGARLFVANADADEVAVIDVEGLRRERELAVCARPRTLAVSGDELAIACQDDGRLARFDVETLAPLPSVELGAGSRPFGVAADPRVAGRFVVALQDVGELVVVEHGEILARVEGLVDARAVTMNDRGLALVSRWRATSEGAFVYVIDLADPRAPRPRQPIRLVRQTGLDSDTDNSGVPSFLDALAFSPDGLRAMAPALKANDVTGLHRTGRPLESQTTARGVFVELYPSAAGEYVESHRFSFNDLDYVSAVTTTPRGERLFVAFLGAQQVLALEPFGFAIEGGVIDVGVAPRGLLADDEGRLFVFAEISRELRVYDVRDLATAPPLLATIPTLSHEPLAPDVLRGKEVFNTSVDPRMSRTSYISCASCHLDGESDGVTWDFTQRGEGLRNTTTLVGLGDQSGPFHWTGNFDEVQDFELDIRLHQGGVGFTSDDIFDAHRDPLGAPLAGRSEELDALAAYVASLRGVGVSPRRLSEAERAEGVRVFAAAGCDACHGGATFSDSASGLRYDVGTLTDASGTRLGAALDGLDTPSLRGLWRTAPYLHDGSAPTLHDVLVARNPDDRHGRTRDLTEAEIGALVRYLESLD